MNQIAPSSLAEVVSLISDARNDEQPLWFKGSGTTPVPDGHIVLSTMEMSGIVDYKPADLTVVVRCGTTLAELDATLQEHGQTAVLPETSPDRTIGGVVASGASGYRRLRYGPTRDRVIGVTLVTGYSEIVHAGGQLVKNVTGYDISRLATGSNGALGFIGEISLKLSPIPSVPRTLRVEDPGLVRTQAYRPTAVLETEDGGFLYSSGVSMSEQAAAEGFTWPARPDQRVVVAVNVPVRLVEEGIGRVIDLGARSFVAQHGVGVIDVGWDTVDESVVLGLRAWADSHGGSLVVHSRGSLDDSVSRWGAALGSDAIERRLKALFDPDRVCNPGVLPGGI